MAVGQIATEWLHTSNNSFYYGCQSRGDELYVHCSCFEDKNQEISQAGEVLFGQSKEKCLYMSNGCFYYCSSCQYSCILQIHIL